MRQFAGAEVIAIPHFKSGKPKTEIPSPNFHDCVTCHQRTILYTSLTKHVNSLPPKTSMPDSVLELDHHDEARALFGLRDENLRRLCNVTGAKVVLRGSQVAHQW